MGPGTDCWEPYTLEKRNCEFRAEAVELCRVLNVSLCCPIPKDKTVTVTSLIAGGLAFDDIGQPVQQPAFNFLIRK